MPHTLSSPRRNKTTKPINQLGIDCDATGAGALRKALEGKKATLRIVDRGEYSFNGPTGYNQLWIDTTMTEDELDAWCCKVKAGAAYVGTFVRHSDQIIEG